ncbi:MAG: SpoIIE family protein phosphatase [Ignavibacteriae bacterium]|nr:SpoIIE family protein phosphatase [Ignavibacteriota bacterium]
MANKILVVDDEPDLQLLIKQNFRTQIRAGQYQFSFALNGEEALNILKSDPQIELLLSDINMPVMDGLTLLKHVPDVNPTIKSVVVTAYGDTKNVRTAMNRGAFDFINKPIDFDDLEITMSKTLKEVETLREALTARDQLVSVRQELSIGRTIQESFLPDSLPQPEGWEIDARFRPAREVAGDFYDGFCLEGSDRVGLVIADVCDKGVGAALFMALIRSLIRAFSESILTGEGPSSMAIQRTNDYLLRNHLNANMFATLFFAVLHPTENRFVWMNGGHNPPIHMKNDGTKELLKPTSPAVGMFPNVVFNSKEITIEPGEFVFAFTDGVPEARDSSGAFFGEHRLEALLEQPASSAKEVVDRMMNALDEHIGTAKQYDDITMYCVRRLPV